MGVKEMADTGGHEKQEEVSVLGGDLKLDLDHLTAQQQRRMHIFLSETFCLSEEQNMAIDGVIPMTQEIFDSIMKRREEAGPVLEDLWTDVFLKYPEFAWVHAEKLAAELGVPFGDEKIPEETADKTEQSWLRLKRLIKEKYGDDL